LFHFVVVFFCLPTWFLFFYFPPVVVLFNLSRGFTISPESAACSQAQSANRRCESRPLANDMPVVYKPLKFIYTSNRKKKKGPGEKKQK
jgi:hypothetical protein